MMRFIVFLLVVGSIGLILYVTKPTQVAYLEKIEQRAAVAVSSERNALIYAGGANPFDEMVAAQSPAHLMKQTRFDDYVVFTVFTTEYEAPGYGTRRVRTYGLLSSLLSFKAD